uniref:Uncharacterized protein n=1 Tax=Mola mola TaxID=94237 RepID=A0A3Q4BTS6_MOLML
MDQNCDLIFLLDGSQEDLGAPSPSAGSAWLHVKNTRKRTVTSATLSAGTCEIVTLDRDSSQPRRTIARQTGRCACRKGQIAGTMRARPACVDVGIVWTRQWCDMTPCLDHEVCELLVDQSGWTCRQPGGRVKTTTVRARRGRKLMGM